MGFFYRSKDRASLTLLFFFSHFFFLLRNIDFTLHRKHLYMYIYVHARIYIHIYVYMHRILRVSYSNSQNTAHYERNRSGNCGAWFPRILDTTFINNTLFVIGTQARIVKISNTRYMYDLNLLYIL